MTELSKSAEIVNFVLRFTMKPIGMPTRPTPKRFKRAAWRFKQAERLARVPAKVKITPDKLTGFDAEWVDAGNALPSRVMLYFHGGAYFMGSPKSHRELTWRLAEASRCRVFAIDYRMVPDHHFPCWVEDAVTAYRYLLQQGYRAEDIVFAGDSAGGNLVLASLMSIRDQGYPMPLAAICISPWADLSCSGATFLSNMERDCMLRTESLTAIGRYIADNSGYDIQDPLLSPLFGNFKDFPRLLVHASDQEILLDDARSLVVAARREGVN
ncbi:MAG TPA: alpha/beta hydrolase, partial [Pseudomonadales bacterium]|nr:alpha/beta hydrolase [Pseudomonadales bacterium]